MNKTVFHESTIDFFLHGICVCVCVCVEGREEKRREDG